MGDIWATDRLILFLAFVVPGFISLKSYQLLFPGEVQPTSEQLIDAVAYSAINYGLLSVPIIAVARSDWLTLWPWAYYLFFAFVVFIAPVVWAQFGSSFEAASSFRSTPRIRSASRGTMCSRRRSRIG